MEPFRFSLKNGITISPHLNEGEVADHKAFEKRDVGNGYAWYTCIERNTENEKVILSLCFKQERLMELSVGIDDPEKFGSSWNEWSKDKEIERAERTRKWFLDAGFPVGNYKWGSIWASYDEKSAYGSGGVRYAL